ncbi:MAG: hypothetical protein M0Z35_08695 [Desulfitobacterium hafniense]|nr:hypothetical protein [Desulfitobacterium hafniense]
MVITEKQNLSNGLLDIVIEKLMEERLFNIAYQEARKTTEYDKWTRELISLSSGIVEILKLDRNLFNQYEELSAAREDELIKSAYRQGVRDGTGLLKELLI